MEPDHRSQGFVLPPITNGHLVRDIKKGSLEPSGPGSSQILEAQAQWNANNYDAAYTLFQAAIQDGIQKDWLATAHNCLGQIEIKRGNLQGAVRHFLACLSIPECVAGDAWEASSRLYPIYAAAGRSQEAKQLKEAANAVNQRGWELLPKVGVELQALAQQQVRRETSKALALQSRDAQARGDVVDSAAFSPDGCTLAGGSGSLDKMIYLWEAASGKKLWNFTGHPGAIHSLAFSPDGRVLASASDKKIFLWEVAGGKKLQVLGGHANEVRSLAFSPDGQLLASASMDQKIILWNVSKGKKLNSLSGHTDCVQTVAFSPDGRTLAGGSWDKTVILWDVATGQKLRELNGHTNVVLSVAFSPDGLLLAGGSRDRKIILWHTASGAIQQSLTGDTKGAECTVVFSPDGLTLAAGAPDSETVLVWDISTGTALRVLGDHANGVLSMAFLPDKHTLAVCSKNYQVVLWDL